MDDLAFGRLVRLSRLRRNLGQDEIAASAGVSRSTVSRIERGHLGELSIVMLRRVAAAVDVRVELLPRSRSADIDRTLNARHAAFLEQVVRWIAGLGGWAVRPEVSFSIFGERGVVDLVAWHAAARALLIVEIKTELIDVSEVLGTLFRKVRLGSRIVESFGWEPAVVACCLLFADSTTNRRRVGDHRGTLRAALPDDGRQLARWLANPFGELRALRFVSDARPGHVRSGFAGQTRVKRCSSGRRAA